MGNLRYVVIGWDVKEENAMEATIREVLNADQAAEFLGFHPYTLREKARLGEIPGRKVGREWRFSRTMLLEWLREVETPPRRGPVVVVLPVSDGDGYVATVEGTPHINGRGKTAKEAYQDILPELEAMFYAKKYRTEMPDKNPT